MAGTATAQDAPAPVASPAVPVEPSSNESRGPQLPAANRLETRRSFAELARRQMLAPSAETERSLGFAYVDYGVLDAAFDHFQAALRFDPHDPEAFEAVARIWRDWGFSALGLPNAYRAVYWAPSSASAQNTLGTLLLKLGLRDAARERFQLARELEPTAAYPLNNLCYVSLHDARPEEAAEWCRAAADADPASVQVRNNLALALARGGNVDDAVAVLDGDAGSAVAAYNQAVLLLAAHQSERARVALMRARRSDPTFAPALNLLKQLAFQGTGH